jgi:hypothetical protein
MDYKLNNILGEYLSFFTGGFMKGGASPNFKDEIQSAKNINDLLPVVQYYFCYTDGGIEREITIADLHDINIRDKIKLHKKTRDVNTEYRDHQEPIVHNLIQFREKNNLDREQTNELYKIGVKFSDITRFDNNDPPRELLPNSINPDGPDAPKGSDRPPIPPGDFLTAFLDYVISGTKLPKTITIANLLELDTPRIRGIGSTPDTKTAISSFVPIMRRISKTASLTDSTVISTIIPKLIRESK